MLNNLKQKATAALGGNLNPMEMVMQVLQRSPEPMKTEDIAKSTGLDMSMLTNALSALTSSGKVSCPKTGCYTVKK